jgi:hypothetical protein
MCLLDRTPLLGRGLAAGVALAALATAVACSGPESAAAHGQTPAGPQVRDTAITHEPCDASSKSARKVDVNGDGKPDIVHVMDGEHEVCRIVDLNFDGAVDAYVYYDAQGRERRRESDFDRDGRPDEIAFYENGVLVRKERETNFDNKIDTWDFFENGRLVRRERDSDGDGVIDQWWTFNNPTNPKCAVVATDRNADGKPDPDSAVDLCADSYGAKAGAQAASASASASAAPSAPPAPGSAAPVASSAPTAPPAATASAAAAAPSATPAAGGAKRPAGKGK